ncbi:MAG: methyltransferase domain-containing protein [Patescibacteria group bacterium]
MKNEKEIMEYICCPKCKSDLLNQNNFLICRKCDKQYEIIEGNIIKIALDPAADLELSIKKWDESYSRQLTGKIYIKAEEDYKERYNTDVYQQLDEYKKIDSDLVYLEIGCGPMFFGQEIANKCRLIIGIDFCPSALKIAKKMLDDKGCKNYLLIQGNILNLPIKEDVIDLIYGAGVIEHFKNTQICINELHRVLKKNGISFNTVPYLNLGSLTYRQIWGNIPNLPVLKQIAEFIHIKLLKGRHMVFGYEMSFLGSTLKNIHRDAGFKKVVVEKFQVNLVFDFIPKCLRRTCIRLASNSKLFWPMVKVIGKK